MGGGAAMRAAAKVAGIGVGNAGFRGFPAMPPVEQHPITTAARKASRPASAIVSSSEDAKSSVLIASQNEKIDASSIQRPCWEIDDWEFAGGVEESIVNSGEPLPRLVFGGAPTIQEAKEATSELKDALEKVYLSSPTRPSGGKCQESGLSLLSDDLDTKACVTSENLVTPSVPKHALQAFKYLNDSPAAQNVVASIASDPNVWHAVLQNEALVGFLESQKISASFSDVGPIKNESVDDAGFQDPNSPENFGYSSNQGQSGDFGDVFADFIQKVKVTVVEMMSSLSDYFQNLFGSPSAAEKACPDADGGAKSTSVDKVLGASFMGLAVMVIMVVVLKRG